MMIQLLPPAQSVYIPLPPHNKNNTMVRSIIVYGTTRAVYQYQSVREYNDHLILIFTPKRYACFETKWHKRRVAGGPCQAFHSYYSTKSDVRKTTRHDSPLRSHPLPREQHAWRKSGNPETQPRPPRCFRYFPRSLCVLERCQQCQLNHHFQCRWRLKLGPRNDACRYSWQLLTEQRRCLHTPPGEVRPRPAVIGYKPAKSRAPAMINEQAFTPL